MSRPRFGWWGYCKWMIRQYPILSAERQSIKTPTLIANYSAMPGSKTNSGLEKYATRTLPPSREREWQAVTDAINVTARKKDGKERIQMVTLVFWNKTHTLEGAAMACHVSTRTAQEWHRTFIREVAKAAGLLD